MTTIYKLSLPEWEPTIQEWDFSMYVHFSAWRKVYNFIKHDLHCTVYGWVKEENYKDDLEVFNDMKSRRFDKRLFERQWMWIESYLII